MSDDARVSWLEEAVTAMAARLDRLEAAVVIQTGTVFGAQGDSEPMTIEHEIEPRRCETRNNL